MAVNAFVVLPIRNRSDGRRFSPVPVSETPAEPNHAPRPSRTSTTMPGAPPGAEARSSTCCIAERSGVAAMAAAGTAGVPSAVASVEG